MHSPGLGKAAHSPDPGEGSCSHSVDDGLGHGEIRGLYSVIEEMLHNSAAQAEGIQIIISVRPRPPQIRNEAGPPQQDTQRLRPQEQQTRVELNHMLEVRFFSFLL